MHVYGTKDPLRTDKNLWWWLQLFHQICFMAIYSVKNWILSMQSNTMQDIKYSHTRKSIFRRILLENKKLFDRKKIQGRLFLSIQTWLMWYGSLFYDVKFYCANIRSDCIKDLMSNAYLVFSCNPFQLFFIFLSSIFLLMLTAFLLNYIYPNLNTNPQ